MKNIHILLTDKPSRLFDDGIELYLGELKDRKGHPVTSYNIYITSDEEIKEGDWYFDGTDLVHKKTKYNDTLVDGNKDAKKIILTTDQDLIKDGVQAIDDEFLEWFVKNSSCECVEVEKEYITPLGDIVKTCYDNERLNYKIIIPKEESKNPNNQELMFHQERQEYFYEDFINGKLTTIWLGKDYLPNEELKLTNTINRSELGIPKGTLTELIGVPKQETLEEAAENHLQKWRLLNNINLSNVLRAEKCKNDFTAGAKWQMNKWLAQFRENGSVKYLDTFETKEEARDAYNASQNKNLHHLLDKDYELNIQFHEAIRESIFSFSVAVYDEKLTFEEWTKKHYGRHIKVSKNLYSEEEVKIMLFARDTHHQLNTELLDIEKWFEQFKKK